MGLTDCFKETADQVEDNIQLNELTLAPTKLDDGRAEVQDPSKEVNLGAGRVSPGYIHKSTSSTGC